MDAITLLKEDHKAVKRLFRQFEKLDSPDRRREVVEKIIKELSVHAFIEEQHFYPFARQIPDAEEHVLESIEEHHIMKWTLAELLEMNPEAERYKAKVTVLIEVVEHHAKEEEEEFFPEVRKASGRKELAELGTMMEKAKATAPSKPDPRAEAAA